MTADHYGLIVANRLRLAWSSIRTRWVSSPHSGGAVAVLGIGDRNYFSYDDTVEFLRLLKRRIVGGMLKPYQPFERSANGSEVTCCQHRRDLFIIASQKKKDRDVEIAILGQVQPRLLWPQVIE